MKFVTTCIIYTLAIVSPATCSAAPSKPNIIFILVDDQGYYDLGCYGASEVKTPRIDAMASEGTRFTDYYAAAPICSPSRAGPLTGCYPRRVGNHIWVHRADSRRGIHSDELTITELFKDNGYATACIGKWHLGFHEPFLASKATFDVSPKSGFKATFKLASLQAGEGRSVGLSLHSAADAMFMKDRISALHQQMIKPGGMRIDSDTDEAKRFPVGAGWAFEIDSIRRHAGKTYVFLKSDHGLIVTPKGLREVYLPHRILSQQTNWWINTVASTLPIRRLEATPPIDLKTACVSDLPGKAAPGIVHRILKKKEGSDGFEIVSTEIQNEFDFFSLSNVAHDYTGYLKLPSDGVYTFHFRPGSRGELSIGGQIVSPDHESPYVTGNIVPRRAWVKLQKGYVPIHWTFQGSGGGTYGGKGCGFTFEGPGIPRTKFRSGEFYHVPE